MFFGEAGHDFPKRGGYVRVLTEIPHDISRLAHPVYRTASAGLSTPLLLPLVHVTLSWPNEVAEDIGID